jgi:hypothetical protein
VLLEHLDGHFVHPTGSALRPLASQRRSAKTALADHREGSRSEHFILVDQKVFLVDFPWVSRPKGIQSMVCSIEIRSLRRSRFRLETRHNYGNHRKSRYNLGAIERAPVREVVASNREVSTASECGEYDDGEANDGCEST